VPGTLLIRADASTEIGNGHVMRCLALAQAWQHAGGHPTFVTATESPIIEARLRSEGMRILHLQGHPGSRDDARFTVDLANQLNAAWL